MDTWGIVFICSACMWVMGAALYVLFVPADVQWWNDPPQKGADKSVEASKEIEANSPPQIAVVEVIEAKSA